MTNYLNQIESDLYKLNSITNGSGEVVEMVAELKEKYRKAKAWDKLMAEIDRITAKSLEGNLPPNISMSAKSLALSIAKKEYESGESDAKK